MAKEDKVRKGFAFYLLMLILILVAAFLIIVMILIFSPGKKILGYQYFSYDKSITQTKTTDSANEDALDFDTIDDIVVNASYAEVVITKNTSKANDESAARDSVIIENHAKGFAKAKAYTGFEYSVKLNSVQNEEQTEERKVLTISVTEPEGFLYFSRNIKINICLGNASKNQFANTSFIITTKKGDVTIGNTSVKKDDELASKFNIQNLTVSTDGGDIKLASGLGKTSANEHEFNSLFLSTGDGRIFTDLEKFSIVNDVKFSINGKGQVSLPNITAKKLLQLVVNNGNFFAKEIIGDVKVLNLKNGSINIDHIAGSFDTNKASDGLGKANITIKKLDKDISIPAGNQANINLGIVQGQYLINTTSGNVTVGYSVYAGDDDETKYLRGLCGLYAPGSIETVTGSIKVLIDDSKIAEKYPTLLELYGLVHEFESSSGDINVVFKGDIKSINKVRTKNNVDVTINKDQKFLLVLNNFDYVPMEKLENRVNIAFIKEDFNIYTYPFKVNFVDGDDDETIYNNNNLTINSNGKVSIHF